MKPIVYTMGKENGTAAAFVSFCQMMVVSGWLRHDEIIVMDNAAIHTGGESEELERMFWETIIDGRPLHVLVIYLPTRSPELNPIELVFHIFAGRVISYRLRHDRPGGLVDRDIIRLGVMF
jgi:transposase